MNRFKIVKLSNSDLLVVYVLKNKCNTKPLFKVINCDRYSVKRGLCTRHQEWSDVDVPDENLHATENKRQLKIPPEFYVIVMISFIRTNKYMIFY